MITFQIPSDVVVGRRFLHDYYGECRITQVVQGPSEVIIYFRVGINGDGMRVWSWMSLFLNSRHVWIEQDLPNDAPPVHR